jgi:hypothetical protein
MVRKKLGKGAILTNNAFIFDSVIEINMTSITVYQAMTSMWLEVTDSKPSATINTQ